MSGVATQTGEREVEEYFGGGTLGSVAEAKIAAALEDLPDEFHRDPKPERVKKHEQGRVWVHLVQNDVATRPRPRRGARATGDVRLQCACARRASTDSASCSMK